MYAGERFNALTHGVGSLLALIGSGALVAVAARSGDSWKIVGVSVYSVTLVLLYGLSTLYHSVRGRAKEALQKIDHG